MTAVETAVAADVEHERTTEPTADGRERCAADGYLWPCPTIRQQPEALLPGGEVLADEIGIGWAIWRRTPPGATYTPEGGVVVGIRDEELEVDEADDGTIDRAFVRVFRVLGWAGGRPFFVELRPGDFDPLLSNLPNSATIRTSARKICALIGGNKGTVSPSELDLAECALRLYRAIA